MTKQVNDIIDNRFNNNIDNNRYSLKSDFKPRTNETQTAYEIASKLKDLDNYAFYLWAVKKLSPPLARELLSETLNDVKIGKERGNIIRNPGALFNSKVQKRIYNLKIGRDTTWEK